jgi:hypothetical protein
MARLKIIAAFNFKQLKSMSAPGQTRHFGRTPATSGLARLAIGGTMRAALYAGGPKTRGCSDNIVFTISACLASCQD